MASVLIVEDDTDAAMALGELLTMSGHEVHVVHTGAAGLEIVAKVHIDVAVLDIGLPDLDGHELARRLRRLLEGKDFLLIAATAYGRPEDIARSSAAGFDAHFVKPVPLVRFLKLIGSA